MALRQVAFPLRCHEREVPFRHTQHARSRVNDRIRLVVRKQVHHVLAVMYSVQGWCPPAVRRYREIMQRMDILVWVYTAQQHI